MMRQYTPEMVNEARELERRNAAPDGTTPHWSYAEAQAAIIENELLRQNFEKHGDGFTTPGTARSLITAKELRGLGIALPEGVPDGAVALRSVEDEIAHWASYPAKDIEDTSGTITVSRGSSVRTLAVNGSTTFAIHGLHFVEAFECRVTTGSRPLPGPPIRIQNGT